MLDDNIVLNYNKIITMAVLTASVGNTLLNLLPMYAVASIVQHPYLPIGTMVHHLICHTYVSSEIDGIFKRILIVMDVSLYSSLIFIHENRGKRFKETHNKRSIV